MESGGKELLRRAKLRLARGSQGAFKLTFATLLIVAALGFTYTGSGGDFPLAELWRVLRYVMAVSGVLLLGALVLPRGSVSNAALAFVTLAGVFTGYVVHTELFHPANQVWMVPLLATTWFALFTAFRVIDNLRLGGIVLTIAAALAVVASGWPEFGPKLLAGMTPHPVPMGGGALWTVLVLGSAGFALLLYVFSRGGTRRTRHSRSGAFALLAAVSFLATLILALRFLSSEGGSGHYADGWEDHPNVRSVAFKETPNLYFVGFDSITPEAIMVEYMGIETTDFHRLMEREMRRFRNLFANAVPTRQSLNTMMALDQDIYLENREAGGLPSYFAGHDLSPLVWLLRRNGYETTSIYQNIHFGFTQGPGIDNYLVNSKSALCSLLDEGERAKRTLAFWGYCRGWTPERQSAADFLVRHLSGVDGDRPQFVIGHLYLPGHSPTPFDYEDREERERFLADYEENFNRAAAPLGQIIEHLRINDPDAILFVFGDHGAMLSRGLDAEDDPVFFLQDWFGILGGVYPRGRCAAEFDEVEEKGYATSLDVVHAIVECLSDRQNPLLEPRRDRFWMPWLGEDHSYDYEEFLYE